MSQQVPLFGQDFAKYCLREYIDKRGGRPTTGDIIRFAAEQHPGIIDPRMLKHALAKLKRWRIAEPNKGGRWCFLTPDGKLLDEEATPPNYRRPRMNIQA